MGRFLEGDVAVGGRLELNERPALGALVRTEGLAWDQFVCGVPANGGRWESKFARGAKRFGAPLGVLRKERPGSDERPPGPPTEAE